jgi:hypothetical protein
MFLNYFKDFSTKKKVTKSLANSRLFSSNRTIKTVGMILDESYFQLRESLIYEMKQNGIAESDITILVYRNKIKKKQVYDYPVFCHNDLSWNATFDKEEVNAFINEPFDLLINYYEEYKVPVVLASHLSKAHFKVGFPTIDKRLNHFMIATTANNFIVFMDELFRYLKILKKI